MLCAKGGPEPHRAHLRESASALARQMVKTRGLAQCSSHPFPPPPPWDRIWAGRATRAPTLVRSHTSAQEELCSKAFKTSETCRSTSGPTLVGRAPQPS